MDAVHIGNGNGVQKIREENDEDDFWPDIVSSVASDDPDVADEAKIESKVSHSSDFWPDALSGDEMEREESKEDDKQQKRKNNTNYSEVLRSTADAIDKLLDDAMNVRTSAVANYKNAEKNIQRYHHSRIYSKMNCLPKSKVAMFQDLSKTREELRLLKEKFERTSTLLNCENRNLRIENKRVEQELQRANQTINHLELENHKLVTDNNAHKKKLARIKADHEKQLREEKAIRNRLEASLREEMRQLEAKHQQEHAKLIERNEFLELEIDQVRGQVVSKDVSLLEMQYGLK